METDKAEALRIALGKANADERVHYVVVAHVHPVRYEILINGWLDYPVHYRVEPDHAPGALDRVLVRHGARTHALADFTLDVAKARTWLRDVVHAAEGDSAALARVSRDGEDGMWPPIDSEWSPRLTDSPSAGAQSVEEICRDVYLLVHGAREYGALTCPPGVMLEFGYDADTYWAAVTLDPGGGRRLLIRSYGEENVKIGAPAFQGLGAAMAVLVEIAAMGNEALGDLRHYIATTTGGQP